MASILLDDLYENLFLFGLDSSDSVIEISSRLDLADSFDDRFIFSSFRIVVDFDDRFIFSPFRVSDDFYNQIMEGLDDNVSFEDFYRLVFRDSYVSSLTYTSSIIFDLSDLLIDIVAFSVNSLISYREQVFDNFFAFLSEARPDTLFEILEWFDVLDEYKVGLNVAFTDIFSLSSLVSFNKLIFETLRNVFLYFGSYTDYLEQKDSRFYVIFSEIGNGVGFSIGRDFGVLFNEKVVKGKRLYEFNSLPSPSGLIISDFGECGISNLKSIDKIFGSEPVAGSYIEADGRLYRYDNFKGYIVPAKGLKFRSVKVCLYGIREAEDFIVRLITHRRR